MLECSSFHPANKSKVLLLGGSLISYGIRGPIEAPFSLAGYHSSQIACELLYYIVFTMIIVCLLRTSIL